VESDVFGSDMTSIHMSYVRGDTNPPLLEDGVGNGRKTSRETSP